MSDDEPVKWGDLKAFCTEKRTACDALRSEQAKAAIPNNRISTATMLGSTLMLAIGFFFYASAGEIRKHEAEEAKVYVTKAEITEHVRRIEARVERVEVQVGNGNDILSLMSAKIDRNFEQIKFRK
jgi:hypothetical protein